MKRVYVKLSDIKKRKGDIEVEKIDIGTLGPMTTMKSAEKLTELLTRKLAECDAKSGVAEESNETSDKGVE